MTSKCGTKAGYEQHKRYREPQCDPCKDAQARYQRWWRFRTGFTCDPPRCRECGSIFVQDHECAMTRDDPQ